MVVTPSIHLVLSMNSRILCIGLCGGVCARVYKAISRRPPNPSREPLEYCRVRTQTQARAARADDNYATTFARTQPPIESGRNIARVCACVCGCVCVCANNVCHLIFGEFV